jgi:tripartite-type tricarboxylate transporter receptor subunit TctC
VRTVRRLMQSVFFAACAAFSSVAAAQESFPSGPIRFIVPFSPGGAADVLAREIGQKLAALYGKPVVIENKPGMGGNIGADAVAKAKPDGYTLLLGTVGIHAAYGIYSKLPYNTARDLQPVIVLGEVPMVIAVHPKLSGYNLSQLVAYAKSHPGSLNFGSAGNGSSTHMVGELFENAAGVQLTHIPYRGSAPAMNDLMGGQIDMMFELVTTAAPVIKSGKIIPLAVTSKRRTAALPDVPTVSELILPGFQGTGWFTVATTAGAPAPIVAKLNKDISAILTAPEMQARWTGLGMTVIGGTPASAARFFIDETAKWDKVIKAANIRAD